MSEQNTMAELVSAEPGLGQGAAPLKNSERGRRRAGSPHIWARFLIRRAIRVVISVWVVVTVAFLVVRLAPGDPVLNALGPTASPELLAQRRAQLGLDQPMARQYLSYLWHLLHGDLGASAVTGQSVSSMVATRLPYTAALALIAAAVVLIIAVPSGLGVAALTRDGRHRRLELVFNTVTGILAAVPEYLLAVALIVIFGMVWPVLPVAGSSTAVSYILPVVALGAASCASLARVARVEGLKVLRQDYMGVARAKRLPPRLLYTRHALPNMLTAVLTLSGSTLAGLVVGSALVEQVFNWPGLGYTLIQSISSRDYNVVAGISLIYGSVVVIITFLVDIVLALTDRRTAILNI